MPSCLLLPFLAVSLLAILNCEPAAARTRHALVVGVSDYKSGITKLKAPRTDAEEVGKVLRDGGLDYRVEVMREEEVKDKPSFMAALNRFAERLRADDEVLFYFSGHGFLVPEEGNFYLLGSAKSQETYLKDLGAGATRDLDTQEKRTKKYQQWITEVAVSEKEIEDLFGSKKPSVVVVIADACRSIITGGKGFAPVPSNIGANRDTPNGTFRIYAASPGEVAYDAPDRIYVEGKGTEKRETSLFTSVLLNEIRVPNVEINQLFGSVKFKVRDQAIQQLGQRQVPHYTEGRDVTSFYFRRAGSEQEIRERCSTAQSELAQLRFGVQSGGVSRETLERKVGELAPCGLASQIELLMRFESHGAGALSTTQSQGDARVDINDPIQQCERMASSPFDPNRAQGVAGIDVNQAVLRSLGKAAERAQVQAAIETAISGCETAVKERGRVARFKYNLSRVYYALATLRAGGLGYTEALEQASRYVSEAVEMGYPAAYNDLALLHQNGEYRDGGARRSPQASRRLTVELLKRGADLGHVLALYNLGMAYKNGDMTLELASLDSGTRSDVAPTVARRDAQAFQYLSRAAEGGFVPAMIEKALLLRESRGIALSDDWERARQERINNRNAAIELLITAASRGSWEAMYRLAETYQSSYDGAADALVWYARAAEAGDNRAQKRLANMLFRGDGLPAPQREAAGRYWRLAADAGDIDAQMRIADLLREGKIPFRPRTDGKSDGGALEVARLYASAFARGNPGAGLRLARLYRTGFPVNAPSDVIPRDAGKAVDLLWATIRQVRAADPTSEYADPQIEAEASFELIEIDQSGQRTRNDNTDLFTADQLDDLKFRFGEPSEKRWVRVSAVGPIVCRDVEGKDVYAVNNYWALIWNGAGSRPPTEDQFDWMERRYRCKHKAAESKVKDEDLGFTKKTRDIFKREWDAALKDKEKDAAKKRAFVDRIVDLVSEDKPRKK
ncbi:MAG: caspase family protein [Hyphomicrobiaceae bacterium]